jgi:hypothetical protein
VNARVGGTTLEGKVSLGCAGWLGAFPEIAEDPEINLLHRAGGYAPQTPRLLMLFLLPSFYFLEPVACLQV